MTYNITLTANHQSLTAEYLPLAAESVQYLTAQVICETEDWTGREIKAMFGQGCTVHEITVTNGEITAKQQLNLTAGDWCVWLVGNSARDGEVIPRITTSIAHISVAPTGGTEGNPFPVIPPTAEEQLRADMGNLADLTTEDKSSLVAAINEAAASGGSKDAVTYTPQTLTEEQQKQARANIGAGQPVFAVNVTEVSEGGGYTADKTAAEIEAAYQAGRTIVCRWAVPFIVSGIPVELPLKSRVHDRDFLFNVNQLVKKQIFTITVEISDSGVKPSVVSANIYEKPADGIPKSDLASDVQTSLDNAMQQDGGTYSNYIKAATTSGVLLLQNEMRVGGLGTGNCVNIDKTQIKIFGKSGTLGLYADASRIHNLETPSVDTDAANKQYVDAAKTEAQQLGLTAATPGQIIKVKTVQDGKPTEWEAVDMPDVGSYTLPTASADTLGGVKVGDGLSIADGVLSASRSANGFEKISTIELTETGLPVYILVPADKSEIYINANQMYAETSGTINFNIGPQADGYSRSTILAFTCGTHNYGMSALVYLRALGEYNNYFNYVGQGVVSSGFSDTVAISSQGLSRMKSWQSSFGRGYIGIIGAITMLGGTVEIWAR